MKDRTNLCIRIWIIVMVGLFGALFFFPEIVFLPLIAWYGVGFVGAVWSLTK